MFNLFQNYDLLSVLIAVSASTILGFVAFFSNSKSITAKSFLTFTIANSLWGLSNYLLYQFHDSRTALFFIRLSMFFAIWQAYSLFQLAYIFPKEEGGLPYQMTHILLPMTVFISAVTLTPLVFTQIDTAAMGVIPSALPGPGIAAFAALAVGLVVGGIVSLLQRFWKSEGQARSQLRLFTIGVTLMFIFIISLNFILPAFFHFYSFVPFGAFFTFPFIAFTGYAVLKHHLLNVKIFATEILAFFLLLLASLEILLSHSQSEVIFRSIILIALLVVNILLIRSVLNEVRQREEMQSLTQELKTANKKLTELDQARAEFISIVSHQLRTPPATIKWYLGAILSGDYGDLAPSLKDALEKTQRTNNSLISLIEDILNVSRIERGKMEFLFEPVDILSLADTTFEQLYPIAQEKKLTLLFNRPQEPLPPLMADHEKLRQVMNNLIDNAIKYTKRGSILVELFKEGDGIRFQVTDTGMGITPEEKKNIFQKFQRGQQSLTRSAGLGLGLYVAKVIITEHRGKIWAESKGRDKGAMFAFTIPIHNDLKQTTLYDLTNDREVPAEAKE